MLTFLNSYRKLALEQAGPYEELLASAGRRIVLAGFLFMVAAYFGFAVTWPLLNLPAALAAFSGYAAASIFSLYLIQRRPRLGTALWLAASLAWTAAAAALFRQPLLAIGGLPLPFVAAVIWDWPGGLIAEAGYLGLVAWLANQAGLPTLGLGISLALGLGGLLGGLVGWVGTRTFIQMNTWTMFYAGQAQKALEQARTRQVELLQIQEDLLKANTELARMSKRFKALQQEAEEARQAKAEFVANVSHELRAPLNMIIGFSEFITQSPRVYGARLPAALLADINTIKSNSLHLSKLVDDVIDLSQVETGRMALHKEFAAVGEIVGAALSAVKGLYESKGLYLESEIEADLPELFCDPNRIRQILINLLSNAGRFTELGGVRVQAGLVEHAILFQVADSGPGIALEDQQKLFQPFQQVDSSIRRKYGGSGLGLSICKSFVEMHNGQIAMESTVGQGTVISFSIPLQSEPAPVSSAARWITPYTQPEKRSRPFMAPELQLKPRLVLCERGSALARIFSRYLTDVEIARAEEPQQAIEELERSPSQALVFNAPVEQAAGAAWLGSLPYETPAVACWVPGIQDAANELGVVQYLLKPVTAEVLAASLAGLGKTVKTALIVEDEPDLMRLYMRILSEVKPRYRLLRAGNGQQALDMMREHHPDAVLMDLTLPEKDGFQVLQEKRADSTIREIPVIIVSARDPANEAIVTNRILVARPNGFTTQDLLDFTLLVSQALAPAARPGAPKPPANPRA